jgi:pyruvate carboxylase
VTTEDPENKFTPDYGRITHYRSVGGPGIRTDGGPAITGGIITPFYDSLLVKICAYGRRFIDAARHMERALQEFRVRGVKTNVPFLLNLVTHPEFLAGGCTTRFIDETPSLFRFPIRRDRASRLLTYAAEITVNGFPGVARPAGYASAPEPAPPRIESALAAPAGSRQQFLKMGPEAFAQFIRAHEPLLVTDTTFRDAHQSLLATRIRTRDMLRVADAYARLCPGIFSIEMWGGATFDTAMRFLREDPWDRLAQLRERIPNILFQMLLRGSNAVGYTSYPDNVVRAFVHEAAAAGIDLFRIFDSLNWVPNMELAVEAAREAGALCEAAICYTGDILDPGRPKYSLAYYVGLAKDLEKRGASLIAIKDMAGLCKPLAAERLIKALRDEVGVPIHFHTHDIGGAQAASILRGADVGLDIADCAVASMSGLTSQPSLNALVESLRFSPRDTGIDPAALIEISRYWEEVRQLYAPFESGPRSPAADLYSLEMPGGQYSNLFQQAKALGLAPRWQEVCQAYARVNQLFGDIIKVTPSSKVVGDMALFMVANNLDSDDVLDPERELAFPESVVEFFEGRLGQPPGGFPPALQKQVLKGRSPLSVRPGANLPAADIEIAREKAAALRGRPVGNRDALSYLLYPRVFPDLAAHERIYSDTSILPTSIFFYGPDAGAEHLVEIEPGKTLIVKLLAIGEPHTDGRRTVFFELNGQPREVEVVDRSLASSVREATMADPGDPNQVGSPLPGLIVGVAVAAGDPVRKGQKLLTIEAMKMETTIYSERAGRVAEVFALVGRQVKTGELLLKVSE